MEELFDIEKFNIVSDEENYYFFRALEPGDLEDIEKGIIIDETGYTKLRTDRERWEEKHEEHPRFNSKSQITLEEIYNHIKMHYSLQTNCISLSSNANVTRTYGDEFSENYVMVKVPKKEMGQKVFHAGQYMLAQIEKQVEQRIAQGNISREILQDLQQIENAKTSEEIKELIKVRYKSEGILNTSKVGIRKGITYRAPRARISSYQSLDEEKTLAKNKIIAKLTVLEKKGIMKPLMSRATNNNSLIQTVGSSFSSSEQIYYGNIEGERITPISKEVLDIFSLLQQAESQDRQIVNELKEKLVQFVLDGKQLEISENSHLRRTDTVKDNIIIEEMYELTGGKVEYGRANSIVKNMFYLAKAQLNARALAELLREITENDAKYERVIEYIENNGFEIEPAIVNRKSNQGYRISESVNLSLRNDEIDLIEQIKNLTDGEQIEILKNGGLSNVRNIMTSCFSKMQAPQKMAKQEYYASAIIDSYDWEQIGIEKFGIVERNELLQKLIEKDCISIYAKLKAAGIEEKNIAGAILQVVSNRQFEQLINEENLSKILQENKEQLTQKLSIEQIERFLGYYDVKGTGIELRDYQKVAVEKTDSIFSKKKFASVVLPTGAGKTYVALTQLLNYGKTKEEQENEQKAVAQKEVPYIQNQRKMLYLAPTNEILEQTKNRIIDTIHGKTNTLGKSKDEIIAEVFPNIQFATYISLLHRSGRKIIAGQYDFIVLDELHRTGAEKWERKLDKLLENQAEETRVLGITATPTRDMDNRNMADEVALKLGYTQEEIENRSHIAMQLDLVDAIKLGLVVNPKVVSCEYVLNNNGSLENLLEQINEIEDEQERKEKLAKYEKLRRSLEKAEGIPEILQANLKQGGKYIVFIPTTDNGEIEDEDGNKIGQKTGEDKIKEYETYLKKCLEGSSITSKYYSMLGTYGDKKNEEQLQSFENDKSEETKFMIVMNKANEGLHIDGIDGIVWFRALDENSKILYLQQLGRAIRSEDPNNPTKEENRPTIIDLAGNTLNVNIDKDIKENSRRDDLELLSIVVDWVNLHGILPEIESTSKQEQKYAATLYRIQEKYGKYLQGFEQFPDLSEENIEQIQRILQKGAEIELWNIELPPRATESVSKIINVDTFEVRGLMRDLVELEREISKEGSKIADRLIRTLQKLRKFGIDGSMIKTSDTIQTLCKRNGTREEEIEKAGLRLEYAVGQDLKRIIGKYRGTAKGTPPTEEQVKMMQELGINFERQRKEKRASDEICIGFIQQLQKLNQLGIDGSMIKTRDTIQTLCKRNRISEEEIERAGLILDSPIGIDRNYVISNYRGIINGIPLTEEQIKIIQELEINFEKRRTPKEVYREFIEQLQKLKQLGIDGSMIKGTDTIQTLCKRNRISEEEIEKAGLIIDSPIGSDKIFITDKYRGTKTGIPPTEEQVKIMQELGIDFEKKCRTQEELYRGFIEQLQKLKQLGIDGSMILKDDTIQTLCKRNRISEEEIEKVGLRLEDTIGLDKSNIIERYRGYKKGTPPTEEQVKIMQELGINFERQRKEKRTSEKVYREFIEQLQKLKQLGIDGSMIKGTDTIQTLCKRNRISEKEIERAGLIIDSLIGKDKAYIIGKYRGTRTGTPPTEEQVKIMRELGVNLKEKQRAAQEIGQATYDAPVEKCDQAQVVLDRLVEKEKIKEEGGITQNE